jgi:DNA invertase Pin-like site-specific DNA recombinase
MSNRIYGYARVSSRDQHLDRQLLELEKYVDEKYIFMDKQSGKSMDRPQYQLLRKVADSGSTIYIKSLDRLGRNKTQIKQELEYFKAEGVRVKILDIPTTMMQVETGQEWLIDMINNLLLEVLSTMAEQDRIRIKTTQAEGIKASKNKGVKFGRPVAVAPAGFDTEVAKWRNGEQSATDTFKKLGMSKTTFYKLVKMEV